MKYFSNLLIVLTVVCFVLGGYIWWQRHDPNRLAFKKFEGNYEKVKVTNPPTRLVISEVKIDLPIYPAKITGGVWETTTRGVSYLVSSPVPGEMGNSILYAHNWASLFGNLPSVHSGEEVEVYYQDGSKKTFVVSSTSLVSPDDSRVLVNSTDKRITLYTCTGFLDSRRFVVIAKQKAQL